MTPKAQLHTQLKMGLTTMENGSTGTSKRMPMETTTLGTLLLTGI